MWNLYERIKHALLLWQLSENLSEKGQFFFLQWRNRGIGSFTKTNSSVISTQLIGTTNWVMAQSWEDQLDKDTLKNKSIGTNSTQKRSLVSIQTDKSSHPRCRSLHFSPAPEPLECAPKGWRGLSVTVAVIPWSHCVCGHFYKIYHDMVSSSSQSWFCHVLPGKKGCSEESFGSCEERPNAELLIILGLFSCVVLFFVGLWPLRTKALSNLVFEEETQHRSLREQRNLKKIHLVLLP